MLPASTSDLTDSTSADSVASASLTPHRHMVLGTAAIYPSDLTVRLKSTTPSIVYTVHPDT